MSTSSTIATTSPRPADSLGAVSGERPVRRTTRFLRSELRMVFGRRRNQVLLAVLAAAPVLLGLAVELATADGDGGGGGRGPAFLSQITQNGLFLVFTGLVVALPLFLPLAVAVVSGEAIAGEANLGTLRYLLAVPVDRTRLLLVKYVGVLAFALVATLTVAAAGLVTAAVLFPLGPVPLLSGGTLPLPDALLRALLVALYVAGMLAGVAAIGMFVSTLTEVPVGAMAATTVLVIIAEILDSIPQIDVIHPWLFTHYWLAFGDLLRDPILTETMTRGLLVQLGYIAVFLSLAWARLTSRDVTS